MASTVVYGRSKLIKFNLGVNTDVELGEITQFSAKSDDMMKENQPLGHNDMSLDVLSKGGSLSFEVKKHNSILPTFFSILDTHLKAGLTDGTRGRSPYFQILDQTTYTDGTAEVITYSKVVLYNMEESVGSSDDEIIYKFEGKYVYKSIQTSGQGFSNVGDTEAQFVSALAEMSNAFNETAVAYVNQDIL